MGDSAHTFFQWQFILVSLACWTIWAYINRKVSARFFSKN